MLPWNKKKSVAKYIALNENVINKQLLELNNCMEAEIKVLGEEMVRQQEEMKHAQNIYESLLCEKRYFQSLGER